MLKVDVFNDYYYVEEPDSKIESNEPMSAIDIMNYENCVPLSEMFNW
jgi:hypothetical protein